MYNRFLFVGERLRPRNPDCLENGRRSMRARHGYINAAFFFLAVIGGIWSFKETDPPEGIINEISINRPPSYAYDAVRDKTPIQCSL